MRRVEVDSAGGRGLSGAHVRNVSCPHLTLKEGRAATWGLQGSPFRFGSPSTLNVTGHGLKSMARIRTNTKRKLRGGVIRRL